jgi:hypothetical protein
MEEFHGSESSRSISGSIWVRFLFPFLLLDCLEDTRGSASVTAAIPELQASNTLVILPKCTGCCSLGKASVYINITKRVYLSTNWKRIPVVADGVIFLIFMAILLLFL